MVPPMGGTVYGGTVCGASYRRHGVWCRLWSARFRAADGRHGSGGPLSARPIGRAAAGMVPPARSGRRPAVRRQLPAGTCRRGDGPGGGGGGARRGPAGMLQGRLRASWFRDAGASCFRPGGMVPAMAGTVSPGRHVSGKGKRAGGNGGLWKRSRGTAGAGGLAQGHGGTAGTGVRLARGIGAGVRDAGERGTIGVEKI